MRDVGASVLDRRIILSDMATPCGLERCVGCGGLFPATAGPLHGYMESSPGCWATYGEVLAREYGDPAYFRVHRLTVDAYAAQHPGQPSPQSIQSVALHLASLRLMFEWVLPPELATSAMQQMARNKAGFRWLEPPRERGTITVGDVHRAGSEGEHANVVRAWAEGVWQAWSAHHETIRSWLPPQRPAPYP